MQESQKLMIDFAEYPNVLIKQLNNSIKEPHSYMAVFVMQVKREREKERRGESMGSSIEGTIAFPSP
jgi:hypothetical protein